MGLYLISSSPEREMNVCMRKGDGVTRREEQTRLAQKSSTNKVQMKTFPLMRGQLERAPAIGTQAGGTQSTRAAPGPIGRQEENVSRGLYCHFCRKKERGGTNALRTGEFE